MVDQDSLAIVWALVIGGIVSAVVLTLFVILRPKIPVIYDYRRWVSQREDLRDARGRLPIPPPPAGNGAFDWVRTTSGLRDEVLFDSHGLDTVMFLRMHRTLFYGFGVITLFTAALLYPVYGTGPNKDLPPDDILKTEGINIISMSNVGAGSARLWATIAADAVVMAILVYLLFIEYRTYANFRIKFRCIDTPCNYAAVCLDLPKHMVTDDEIFSFFDKMFPGEVVSAQFVRDAAGVLEKINEYKAAITKREALEYALAQPKGQKKGRPQHRPGCCGCCCCFREPVDSIEFWQGEQDKLATEIQQAQAEPEKLKPAHAVFIVFSNKKAASMACQTQFGVYSGVYHVAHAADPSAVNWKVLGVPLAMAPVKTLISWATLTFFLLFWSIVVAAIMGLANLSSLAQTPAFSWLQPILELSPRVTGFIEGLLPVVILIVLNMIPMIVMKILAGMERLHALYILDHHIEVYIFFFVVFASYIYPLVGGALLTNIQGIIDGSISIPDLLADAIPKQAIFFMVFIILQCFSGAPLALLDIVRVIVRPILGIIWKTTRLSRQRDDFGAVPDFGGPYAASTVVVLIGFCYSSIAPLICAFTTCYFGYSYLAYKYNLCYGKLSQFEGGAFTYRAVLQQLFVAAYIKQLTMIGLMGINKSAGPLILEIVILMPVIVCNIAFRRMFYRPIKHGALEQMMQNESGELIKATNDKYRGIYTHPGLVPLPPYVNLNGLENTDAPQQTDVEQKAEEEKPAITTLQSVEDQFFDARDFTEQEAAGNIV